MDAPLYNLPPRRTENPRSSLVCPLCAERLTRVRRRLIDRLLSQFVPIQRYQCENFSCKWVGNLRVKDRIAESPQTQVPTKHAR